MRALRKIAAMTSALEATVSKASNWPSARITPVTRPAFVVIFWIGADRWIVPPRSSNNLTSARIRAWVPPRGNQTPPRRSSA